MRGRRLWALVSGTATPHRLRRLGALLVLGCLLAALASGLGGWIRADALGASGTRLAALEFDAEELNRALNGANALATSGFAAGGAAPTRLADYDYDSDVTGASLRLVHAATLLDADGPEDDDAALVERMAYELPRYASAVGNARATRGQDQDRARAELDNAVQLMGTSILPASSELLNHRREALSRNFRGTFGFPWWPVLLAAAAVLAIGYASLRERRRTQRILNPGLVAAGVLAVAALVWWSVASVAAQGELATARTSDAVATDLSRARVLVLQARTDETVTASGGGTTDPGGCPNGLSACFDRLLSRGGPLDAAAGAGGTAQVDVVRAAVLRWRAAALGGPGTDASRTAFVQLGTPLSDAIGTAKGDRSAAVERAGAALAGIASGPAAILVAAAVAAAAGIGVRLREYRG